jgi:hypothetical protein
MATAGALAAPDAEARHPAPQALASSGMQKRHHDPRARRRDGMAEPHSPAPDIQPGRADAELAARGHGHDREGLVDLPEVDVLHRPANAREQPK